MVSKEKVYQMMDADASWAAVLYLFQQHGKLQTYLKDEYFELDNGLFHVKQLLKLSRPWSKK